MKRPATNTASRNGGTAIRASHFCFRVSNTGLTLHYKVTPVKTRQDRVVCALFSCEARAAIRDCRLLRRVKKQEPKRKERSLFLSLPSRLISCSSTPGGHPNVTTDSYLTGGGALPNNGVSRMIGASR